MCMAFLGPTCWSNKDWFDDNDEEIQRLLENNPMAFLAQQNVPNCSTKAILYNKAQSRKFKKSERCMIIGWVAGPMKSRALQNTVTWNASTTPSRPSMFPSTSPTLKCGCITVCQWKRPDKTFASILNRESSINDTETNHLPQANVNENLELLPSEDEVDIAINQLPNDSVVKRPI